MKPATPLMMVPFREVRHFQPDDCLHYESIAVRGHEYDWTIPAHRHEGLHQFHLLTRGAVVATIDGERHDLRAPAMWMLAPGAVHGFAYERDSAGQQITVPTAALQVALAHSPLLAAQLARTIIVGSDAIGADALACEQLFSQLAQEFGASRPGRVEALHAHAMLIALWLLRRENATRGPPRRQALRDTLTHRYRSLLELHFRRHQPIGFYADALGVTPDHLSRTCRATSGIGALDLLHERMLLEARRMLAYTPVPVTGIAQQLGFEDPGYFSRFFTRRAGLSPSAYRESVTDGRAALPEHDGPRRR